MGKAPRHGIIDLGTNTFHLLIVEQHEDRVSTVFRESRASRIGKGGINQDLITDEGILRALTVLGYFREKLDEFEVPHTHVYAYGTSAVRNARNRKQFIEEVWTQTQIPVTVIDGEKEAELIYYGVRTAVELGTDTSLIVDIGGGSVEFIIGNARGILWKQSFEIGGQRLMEKFMQHDPISPTEVRRLYNYLAEQLIPLANAVHQYAPTILVGSAGSFETLVDMDYLRHAKQSPSNEQSGFELSIESFYTSYQALIASDHGQRLRIPGMIPLRVDMIVVAVCLIDYLIRTFSISKIAVSNYSLKEGAVYLLTKV